MRIVINRANEVELSSLYPGDVLSCYNSEYWIVTDSSAGSRISVVRLDDGFLAHWDVETKVTPLPDACLKV